MDVSSPYVAPTVDDILAAVLPLLPQGVTQDSLLSKYRAISGNAAATADDMFANVMSARPALGSVTPPPVALASVVGTAATAARSDHTHQSSVQAQRVALVLNASGVGSWTYPSAYGAGVVPVIETTVETPSGASYAYDAKIVAGTVTNSSCQIMVNKIANSVTLPGLATSLLGFVINVLSPASGTVFVHCWARTPS